MSSISSLNQVHSLVMTSGNPRKLSETTIQRLLALGIDPATVQSETEAQILIAQAEAAGKQDNTENGGKQQEKRKAELQQNIFNTMDMISVSNKLILGL